MLRSPCLVVVWGEKCLRRASYVGITNEQVVFGEDEEGGEMGRWMDLLGCASGGVK